MTFTKIIRPCEIPADITVHDGDKTTILKRTIKHEADSIQKHQNKLTALFFIDYIAQNGGSATIIQ